MSAPREGQPLPSFWLLHASGWLAYGIAMTFSRIGIFPLRFMVVSKGTLMVTGFAISLGLRYLYRPLIRRGTPLITLLVVAVLASYVASMIWTAADNLLAFPINAAFARFPPSPAKIDRRDSLRVMAVNGEQQHADDAGLGGDDGEMRRISASGNARSPKGRQRPAAARPGM